jgi:hypothetical protein
MQILDQSGTMESQGNEIDPSYSTAIYLINPVIYHPLIAL